MRSIMKKLTKILIFPAIIFLFFAGICLFQPKLSNDVIISNAMETEIQHKSSILIERKSGKMLNGQNEHERVPIASVTKLMTILLTLEKIEQKDISLEDKVRVSENAFGMGGSQIFLDANVDYSLSELLKSVVVASANDSSVALAEYIAGSEANFVRMMNDRASQLNMNDTHYSNCTGLPTPDGVSSAFDQAILLNKVLDYDLYHTYSSIWLEDFVHPSGRTTQMANTNKLARFYSGCIGGKTGSTNQAKYCLAIGAKRNDMELISVVLGVENSKDRFKLASDLLNYGFANFEAKTLFDNSNLTDKTVAVKGQNRATGLKAERNYTIVTKKNEDVNFSLNYHLPNMLTSVKENQVVGNVEIVVDGQIVDTINLLATDTISEAKLWDYMKDIMNS